VSPRKLVGWLVRYAMRQGWHRGVVDGNQAWAVIGGVAVVAHLAGRVMHREPEVVFLEKLRPEDVVQIRHVPRA
jgi:hypothetical protein